MIYKDDLIKANNSYSSSMEELISSSNNLKSGLTSMDTSELVGPGFDAIRSKLSVYSSVLNDYIDLCSDILSSFQKSNNILKSTMASNEVMDISKNNINVLERSLNQLRFQLNNVYARNNEVNVLEEDSSYLAYLNREVKNIEDKVGIIKRVSQANIIETGNLISNSSAISSCISKINSINVSKFE